MKIGTSRGPNWRKPAVSVFVQDTWRVKSAWTLDYGLRWDRQAYGYEEQDRRIATAKKAGGLLQLIMLAGVVLQAFHVQDQARIPLRHRFFERRRQGLISPHINQFRSDPEALRHASKAPEILR